MDSLDLDINELRRQLEEAKDLANRERENANRERENANRQRERAVQAEAKQAPTTLDQYLKLVRKSLISTLLIEFNPAQTASGSVTSVNEKYYPLELCRWGDFDNQLEHTFNQFATVFASQALFPSETDVLGVQRELSPTSRKDEQDIRPFVRSAIEKPAERIVAAYQRRTLSDQQRNFYFQNNAYSLEYRDPEREDEFKASSPTKKISPERKKSQPIPDRWGICEEEGGIRRVCVGEYKAAHKAPDKYIRQALATAPENLFLEVLWRKQSGKENAIEEKRQGLVAQILCQAFHYMIESGLLFGYITSGQTLILLKIEKSMPWRLYFHFISVDMIEQGREFETRYAPATQLATLVLLALRVPEMPRDWIIEAENCGIYQWPLVPQKPLDPKISLQPQTDGGETSESSEENDDPTDSDYNDPSQSNRKSEPRGERRQSPRKRTAQVPIRNYCTQACLAGLVQKLPLDASCPNFSIHKQSSTHGKHPFTKERLCSLLHKQLSRSLDQGCECLDKKGLFGAIGVLFKITLIKYGYTFVAKGVQEANERDLVHEFNVYKRLFPLQGLYTPICLGKITLERPYPLVSMAKVTQMMLMSWAGNSLWNNKLPEDVDFSKEEVKIMKALKRYGVRHEDPRLSNMVYTPDKRVMVIDFNQATLFPIPKRKDLSFHSVSNPPMRNKRRKTTDASPNTKTTLVDQTNTSTHGHCD